MARKPAGQEQMETTRPTPFNFEEKKGRGRARQVKPSGPDKEYKLNENWWDALSPEQQRHYQEEHPNSKYADEQIKDDHDDQDVDDEGTATEEPQVPKKPKAVKGPPKDEVSDIQQFKDYNLKTQNFNVTQPKRPKGPGLGEPNTKKGLDDRPAIDRVPAEPPKMRDLKDVPKLKDVEDRQPTRNRKGGAGHGLVKTKQLKDAVTKLPEQEQKFLTDGGMEPKSKQREALGSFLKKDARNLAGGYVRDAGSALEGLNSVRKILSGDRLEPSDWKKLGKMMLNLTGWLAATSLSGGSLGVGFLAFGALKHAIVPAVGYMFKKDWTHKSKTKRKIDWDRNSDRWLKDEDEDDSLVPSKSKSKKSQKRHAAVLAADNTELLTMMFERLGDYMAEGTIPASAWTQAILDHPGKDHSSKE
jgi:hypothetical protein